MTSARTKIKLVSTGKTKEGNPTGTFYTTDKNKREMPEKFIIKKYDRRAYNEKTGKNGMHIDFKEDKIKQLREKRTELPPDPSKWRQISEAPAAMQREIKSTKLESLLNNKKALDLKNAYNMPEGQQRK